MLVNGKEINITHPDKILFHKAGYTKTDLIEYYLSVNDALLTHNKGRPVVFIRYPHGAPGYSFFQKNLPGYAPAWMHTVEMGKHKPVRYLILEDIADLIWLVQMHALEFHVINVREPNFTRPDMMVFDIDPPDDGGFDDARQFALAARPHLETLGYKPFVKTSGKRGVHICCPVYPQFSVDKIMEAAEKAARYLMEKIPGTTLEVRKERRKGKLLIDIYRNRAFQTFSMVYGTRHTDVASVSMPVTWEMLESGIKPGDFTIKTVPSFLKTHGDPWKDMEKQATEIFL